MVADPDPEAWPPAELVAIIITQVNICVVPDYMPAERILFSMASDF
jgi:hypothetical protein